MAVAILRYRYLGHLWPKTLHDQEKEPFAPCAFFTGPTTCDGKKPTGAMTRLPLAPIHRNYCRADIRSCQPTCFRLIYKGRFGLTAEEGRKARSCNRKHTVTVRPPRSRGRRWERLGGGGRPWNTVLYLVTGWWMAKQEWQDQSCSHRYLARLSAKARWAAEDVCGPSWHIHTVYSKGRETTPLFM